MPKDSQPVCLIGTWIVCPVCGERIRRIRTKRILPDTRTVRAECTACQFRFNIIEPKLTQKQKA